MTTKAEPGVEAVALLPCPFCETVMHDHGHCFSHPWPASGDCVIRHYSFDKQKAKAWNTRASLPQDKRIPVLEEALREILAKESGAGYDPIQALGEIEHIARAALSRTAEPE